MKKTPISVNLSRLQSQLLTSGIQQSNNALYQVITQLLLAIQQLQSVSSKSVSSGGIVTLSPTIFLPGLEGIDGLDGIPGSIGRDGTNGINGYNGIPGIDGIDGLDGFIPSMGGFESILTFTSGLTRLLNTITDDLITGKSGGQTIIGGTGSGENLTLTSTSHATKGIINLGTTAAGENVNVIATLGTERIPTFTDANWFKQTGWENPTVGPGLIHNADGTGICQSNVSPAVVVGRTYKVVVTLSSMTVGTVRFQLGGYGVLDLVTGLYPTTMSANGTYTFYFIALTTNGTIVFNPSNTARFTISALSSKELVDGTGDITVDGNLSVRSVIKDAQGIDTLFLNNGRVGIQSTNLLDALTIGNNGGVQLDHSGTYKMKRVDGSSLDVIAVDALDIVSFQNQSGAGSAAYGTPHASGGDVYIKCRGVHGAFFKASAGGIVGFGHNSPTATIHPKAGTASANTAPLKLNSGTLMTTPEVGAVEYDANNFYFTKNTALRESILGVLFTQTADKTITNTVTETSIIGTGIGTVTLPANFFIAGKTIRLRIGGVYTTPLAATPSIVIKIKLGSVVIATITTSSLLSGATNLEFDGEILITCRTTGSSGTVILHGDIEYATGVAGTISVDPLNNAGATTTINTTISNVLDITITWDTATSTRSVKSTISTIEVIN